MPIRSPSDEDAMSFKSKAITETLMGQVTRRRMIIGGLGAMVAAGVGHELRASTLAAPAAIPGSAPDKDVSSALDKEVSIENFSAAGKSEGIVRVAKVIKSDAEWRAQLSPLAYGVTRREGTEMAFSGEYANHADGIYRCVCCDTALYDSKTKYDSGTGWPSFWQPISPRNVVNSPDSSLGMERDAISCRRCDAHLGHVFDDGPRPTGLRYCMNAVAMRFAPRA
jgi:peptide-methionine (R)-S-oxide reductase